MYALSRSLYRELVPMLKSPAETGAGRADRRHLLGACEEAIRRLVLQPDGCAHPVRSLFREIQHLFPLTTQVNALEIVRVHVEAGKALSARLEATLRRDCEAFTRQGHPCRRDPRPGQRFCPSHRHLSELTLPEEAEVQALG
jgi:hypothetical protein